MSRVKLFLVLIIFLATVLRLYQLGKTPIGLEWDEVALGYDAFSILKTGRDQFMKLLPTTFRSLDDYKPPIYEYIAVPSIGLFGLNAFATRFPSAFFGILTVIATFGLTFLIARRLFASQKAATTVTLLASFLLAISPWHLQFSRAAFEVNVSVFITVIAVSAFLAGLAKPKFFILAAFLFGLDLFSYHSTRVVAPLLLISLFFLFNRYLPERKYIFLFFMIFGTFFLFFLPILTSPEAQIRFKATNIFDPGARYLDEKDLPKIFLERRGQDKNFGFELAGKIFHNQRLIFLDYDTLKKSFNNYISNFGFDYLFITGDAPLHHAPGFGLLYIWEFPFLLAGFLYILFKGLNRYTLLLLLWLLFVPIPNAVTREAPHSVRTELFLPVFQIITAVGIFIVLRFIRHEKKWVVLSFIAATSFFLLINNSFYLHQYYVHTNLELSKNWFYGRKEAVEITERLKNDYDKVLVSMNVDMPYIFWLFYSKYDPKKYLAEGGTVSGGFADERNNFDKYEFRNFNYNSLPKDQRLLLVGTTRDFPPDADILNVIHYLDGSIALKIGKNKL